MNTLAQATSATDVTTRLDALAEELTARGWTATLDAPPGRVPALDTASPARRAAGPARAARVYAQPRADGTWTYWWPWAEPIADTAAAAAAVITRAAA
jgi:hypothetical protein